jgi:putative FmdB family regulatory protein
VPTYEYKCSSCEHRYETRESFDAPARQACPRCGAVAKRVLFPPPIVFKGSGFYITDSRKGSSQATVSDSTTPSATSAASPKTESAGESKPAPAASTSSDGAGSSSSSDA